MVRSRKCFRTCMSLPLASSVRKGAEVEGQGANCLGTRRAVVTRGHVSLCGCGSSLLSWHVVKCCSQDTALRMSWNSLSVSPSPPVIGYTIALDIGRVTCVVPACCSQPQSGPWGFLFPVPRRFILRLETSKAFLYHPAANSAPLFIIWHVLPVISIVKSRKGLRDIKPSWVSFDLINISVNQM